MFTEPLQPLLSILKHILSGLATVDRTISLIGSSIGLNWLKPIIFSRLEIQTVHFDSVSTSNGSVDYRSTDGFGMSAKISESWKFSPVLDTAWKMEA